MLADNHLIVREGLVTVLSEEPDFAFVGFAEGAKLFITEGTVKPHVKSIFYKLDVISRSEAVSTAIRKGLVRGHG